MDNFYWILGLTPDTATVADIKANYRKLAKRWHPDHDHSAEAAEMFLKLKEAYETLSDPERKAEYDRKYNFEDAANGRESPFVQTIVSRMRFFLSCRLAELLFFCVLLFANLRSPPTLLV